MSSLAFSPFYVLLNISNCIIRLEITRICHFFTSNFKCLRITLTDCLSFLLSAFHGDDDWVQRQNDSSVLCKKAETALGSDSGTDQPLLKLHKNKKGLYLISWLRRVQPNEFFCTVFAKGRRGLNDDMMDVMMV